MKPLPKRVWVIFGTGKYHRVVIVHTTETRANNAIKYLQSLPDEGIKFRIAFYVREK